MEEAWEMGAWEEVQGAEAALVAWAEMAAWGAEAAVAWAEESAVVLGEALHQQPCRTH